MAGALDLGKSKGKKKNDDVEAQRRPKWFVKLSIIVGACLFLKPKDKDDSSEESDHSTKNLEPGVAASASSSSSSPSHFGEIKFASNLKRFSFDELKEVTHHFRPTSILGQGGFGCVFKGMIRQTGSPTAAGSSIPVAVKILNHGGLQGHKEWLTEINYLGALVHPNIVKLIGYCIEDEKRVLVYEFMPRGSLDNHLFRRTTPLPWSMRLKIVVAAAKGLAFLHEEASRTVIFRDFKTSNILLDSEYNAKLSDFGLAKDGPEGDSSHVSTRVMGTLGYAAPEYVMTGHLTVKSDVYSFGVVLLELLTGRRVMDKNRPRGEQNLVEWVKNNFSERNRFYKMIDPQLEGHFSLKAAQAATQVAVRCLSRQAKSRPTMSEVVGLLEPLLHLHDMPFCATAAYRSIAAAQGPSSSSSTSSARSLPNSPFRPHYPLPYPSPKARIP